MTHATLVMKAMNAINGVHADQSVNLEQTLDSLEELYDHLQILIDAIREDMKRESS